MPRVFLITRVVLFTAFLASCKPHVTPNSLACSQDSDCVVIGRGGCCGTDLAVHKDFAEKLQQPSDEKCHTMRVQCAETKALCIEKKCTLKTPSKKLPTN